MVLRHENQVLRRRLGGRSRWDHADRLWLTALSRLVNPSGELPRHAVALTSCAKFGGYLSVQFIGCWCDEPR
jgi:hypothetical protein